MKGICVRSEIKPLKKVLLHRPGRELLNLTPDRLPELLFDDIPFLKVAQQEHDAFAQILRNNGTEVVYLEDLMAEVFKLHPEVIKPFIYQWLSEGNIKTRRWQDKLYDYLVSNFEGKALVEKTMEGITLKEMGGASAYSLQDMIAPADDLIVDPMPNLYFTRDPFAVVGEGVNLNRMYSVTRNRETLYGKYVFKYHPDYKDVSLYFRRDCQFHTEGGEGSLLPYGFAQTSGELDAALEKMQEVFADMLELAQVEKTMQLLAEEIEKTRRRVNALEYVMIPELEENIKYISMKLEENENSTKVRLLKVKEMVLQDAHNYK